MPDQSEIESQNGVNQTAHPADGKQAATPLTPDELDRLFTACIAAKSHSYSPYSHFRVGCAALLADNTMVTGCNVENITYGLTVCAERTAYLKAVSEGKSEFRAVAVNTDVADRLVLPCGQCRQFMWEFGDVDVYVVSSDKGKSEKYRLSELLPGGMVMRDLEEGRENRPAAAGINYSH